MIQFRLLMLIKIIKKQISMKTAGIILVVLGVFSIIGAVIAASKGYRASFGGITFLVLGAFLISRAEKKKEEEAKKKMWNQDSDKS